MSDDSEGRTSAANSEHRHPYDHPANIAAERQFYEATNADRRSTSVQQNGS